MMSESDWKLKILSGHYLGSELDLAPGRYQCGCDDNDDLVFQEPGLMPGHFELDVSEDMVRLIRLRKRSETDLESEVLEQGALVVIEGFQFAVGNGSVTWPEPLTEPVAESVTEPESQEQATPPDDTVEESEPQKQAALKLQQIFGRRDWMGMLKQFRVKVGVVGAGVGILMLIAAGAMTSTQEDPIIGRSIEDIGVLENQISMLQLPDVRVISMADGSWSLEGYVDTSSDMERLKQWVETNSLQVTLKVKITEELVKGSEIALAALGYANVSVEESDRAGYVILTGNVSDDEQWKINRGRLQVDVPGILGFEDRVTADTKLARAPFPNLVVRGIYMGKTPFFVLSNGEKYFVGSQLEYGYRVEDIAPDMLQLRRGDKLIQYRLGVE